jgi:hypothetical protein
MESLQTYSCSRSKADSGLLGSDSLRLAKADREGLGRQSQQVFSARRVVGRYLIFNGSDTFLANQLRLASADPFEAPLSTADMK